MTVSNPYLRSACLVLALVSAIAHADGLAILPSIGFLWADGETPTTAELFLAEGMHGVPDIIGIRSTNPDVEVVGYDLFPDSGRLLLKLRLTHGRAANLDSVAVAYRSSPAEESMLGSLRVVPATAGTAELRWARLSAAADIGMVFAGALQNDGGDTVVVHALSYAPDAIGQGLVLVRSGALDAFGGWSDQVMSATAAARWPDIEPGVAATLRGRGAAGRPSSDDPAPRSSAAEYRVALSDALPNSRWADASRMDVEVLPGEALFVAITVASFRYDISGLALTITPVATVETTEGCCVDIGAGSSSTTRGDLPF